VALFQQILYISKANKSFSLQLVQRVSSIRDYRWDGSFFCDNTQNDVGFDEILGGGIETQSVTEVII
jgi:hypothetical protein